MDGSRIRNLRNEKRISLGTFSQKTGISKSYLSLLERNIQRNPSIVVLNKIAAALEVNLDYLLGMEPEKHSDLKLEINVPEAGVNKEKIDLLKKLLDGFYKT